MGGAMALHLACRYHPDVGGVFALSSFLNKGSVAFQVTQKSGFPIKWEKKNVQFIIFTMAKLTWQKSS